MAKGNLRKAVLKAVRGDCFAHDSDNTCRVTFCTDCSKCSFYKTEQQLSTKRKQTEKHIERLFDMSYKEFLLSKGYAK